MGEKGSDGEVGFVTNGWKSFKLIPVVRICAFPKFWYDDATCELAGVFHTTKFVACLRYGRASIRRPFGPKLIIVRGWSQVPRVVPVGFFRTGTGPCPRFGAVGVRLFPGIGVWGSLRPVGMSRGGRLPGVRRALALLWCGMESLLGVWYWFVRS